MLSTISGSIKRNPHWRVSDGDFGVPKYATLLDHHDAAGGGGTYLDEVGACGGDVEGDCLIA